jgi:16S rRNA (guanine966-N2)-methyltransferase
MRIISGTLKGRRIPFNNRKFGNARVTSEFVKEAVFGALGPELTGKRLIDPFAGSGQMGYEGASRGATAWLNDRDKKRHAFIRTIIQEWELAGQIDLSNEDWHRWLKRLSADASPPFHIAYVDPPYDAATPDGMPESEACLRAIADLSLLDPSGQIFVQHTRRIILPDRIGNLQQTKSKRYGDSLLSRYRLG